MEISNPQIDDELTLKIWDGDPKVLREIIQRHYSSLTLFVAKNFPLLTGTEPEDIAQESLRIFWCKRDSYDGETPLFSWLFGIAKNVAKEHVGRRRNWVKAAKLEKTVDDEFWASHEDSKLEDRLDEKEDSNPELLAQVAEALKNLRPLYRDILEAYAFAGSITPNATKLGIELGKKHKDGIPIPSGTIRVYHGRAKEAFVSELKKVGCIDDHGRLA